MATIPIRFDAEKALEIILYIARRASIPDIIHVSLLLLTGFVFSLPVFAQQAKNNAPLNLNGFWKDGARAVRIVQNGNDVSAYYVEPYECDHRDGTGKKDKTNIDFTAKLDVTVNGITLKKEGYTLTGETTVCNFGKDNPDGVGLARMKMKLKVIVFNGEAIALNGTYESIRHVYEDHPRPGAGRGEVAPRTLVEVKVNAGLVILREKLMITKLALNDIDDVWLKYLSVGPIPDFYYNGHTRVHGTITIEGAKEDELTNLELQILQGPVVEGSAVVATAQLADDAKSKLLKPFGDAKKISIDTSQLLFELPSSEASKVNTSTDGTLRLRVKATTKAGEKATAVYVGGNTLGDVAFSTDDLAFPVQILVRYTKDNRYGQRDEDRCEGTSYPCGGDDWVKPSVKVVAEHFTGIKWGDFSNMNGGKFPPHGEHQTGNSIDGYFEDYEKRDAAAAKKMINYLNDATYGSRIVCVFVAYTANDATDSFWNAINKDDKGNDIKLNDGRLVRTVIRPEASHTSHFHWDIDSSSCAPGP
jgi:hypothetical protein